ncbi:sigma-70 family RNA polymerase sigma factor [Oceanispirochaeta sp.]|uniref:RNA polymerase sigma factor n=1 Tax=Oceanispirochaeta sp. TaxID=2035350 RepID=UPI00262ACB9B|nr:sigma-70 family RNA polymerase sigma factor [Oceanispirochaeta sp.]MDA3958313.1 sigma-70 family RNA polymerase sigma factor [Oceanispirochaeta sp.]
MHDRSLLIKGAGGDNKAIRQLWDIWSPKISIFLRGSVPSGDMDDLTQEIMLKIFRSLASYNPVFAPSTWIYTIAGRTRTDWQRQQSKFLKSESENPDSEEMISLIPGPYEGPEAQYIRLESEKRVDDFLQRQNVRDRKILFLYCHEGLSGRAIARVLMTPAETIRYRLKILKAKLKEEMLL